MDFTYISLMLRILFPSNNLIANWMSANHLSLNPQKTTFVILTHNRQKPEPILFLNGTYARAGHPL